MQAQTLIHLSSVSYSHDSNDLIKDLSFDVSVKQVISIIGYNGSGKSTLLKLLLGSIFPTAGSIQRKSGLQVGYVPQKLSFMQDLPITVRDFLSLYSSSWEGSADFACSLLEITSLLGKPLSGLSGGQLQRVLIYNALLGSPDILLLDEPTAGLDVRAQKEFYTLIDHIHKEHGITLVIVSHDMHTVYSNSDMVICLHQGVCCIGSPDDVSFSQELNELFGGYIRPYLHTHTHDR